MIKYFRNSFLAVKVSYCNEFYRLCEKMKISYKNVISTAASDSRINESHTNVPGHDGRFGFGGTCFSKIVIVYYLFLKKIILILLF